MDQQEQRLLVALVVALVLHVPLVYFGGQQYMNPSGGDFDIYKGTVPPDAVGFTLYFQGAIYDYPDNGDPGRPLHADASNGITVTL